MQSVYNRGTIKNIWEARHMSKHISIIEDVELDNGMTLYVQAGQRNGQISMSVDDRNVQVMYQIDVEAARKLADAINKVLSELTK